PPGVPPGQGVRDAGCARRLAPASGRPQLPPAPQRSLEPGNGAGLVAAPAGGRQPWRIPARAPPGGPHPEPVRRRGACRRQRRAYRLDRRPRPWPGPARAAGRLAGRRRRPRGARQLLAGAAGAAPRPLAAPGLVPARTLQQPVDRRQPRFVAAVRARRPDRGARLSGQRGRRRQWRGAAAGAAPGPAHARQRRTRRLPVRRRRQHPPAPGPVGRLWPQPLPAGRRRPGPALEPARLHRQPGDRHATGRQPWLDGRHQPGRHWPWPPVLVQPSPAVAALSRPPPEDIPMQRPRPRRRAPSRTPPQAHAVPLALLAALMPALAVAQARTALPEEGRVVAGKASIDRQERTLTVTQQSGRAVLEWRSFDIGPDAAVRFIQPSSSSVALNRITGGNPSRIAGRLSANGHVYLVNSAGVLFAP